MDGAEVRPTQPTHQRKMNMADVKVQDIELIQLGDDMVELNHFVDGWIPLVPSRSQRGGHTGTEMCAGPGITTGEQDDFMAPAHEFLGEVVNDPFGASIPRRWNTFVKGRNLSNSHVRSSYSVSSSFLG
jgi:hypothetical protein